MGSSTALVRHRRQVRTDPPGQAKCLNELEREKRRVCQRSLIHLDGDVLWRGGTRVAFHFSARWLSLRWLFRPLTTRSRQPRFSFSTQVARPGRSTASTWCVGTLGHLEIPPKISASYSTDDGATWAKISGVGLSPSRDVLRWKIPGPPARRVQLRISNSSSGDTVSNATPIEIIPSQAVHSYRWRKVTEKAAFAARDGAGSLTFKNRMFLLGGWNPANKRQFPMVCNNEVWRSVAGKDWVLVKKNTHLDR